eukprot:COSAG02_NODE_8_length_60691_cov_104.994752_36_plen_74_part_00
MRTQYIPFTHTALRKRFIDSGPGCGAMARKVVLESAKGAEKQVEKGAKEKRRRERRETQRVAFSSSRPWVVWR